MSSSGDAAEQIVRISLDGVEYAIRIAGAGAKQLAAMLMAVLATHKSQPATLKVSGPERLKRMLKSGQPLDVFSIKETDLREFVRESKNFGIVYCAIRSAKPRADGTVEFLVRQEDAPKINRIVERLQYASIDKASIKSEIVKVREEQSVEPSVPDVSDTLDVEGFLDDIMPDEGKAKTEQNQAVQPPTPEKAEPSVKKAAVPDFFSTARTSENPSELGLDTSSSEKKTISDEAPSVREEIAEIRAELKKEAARQREEPQRGKPGRQQTTRHTQPPHRKPKSKNYKER